MISQITTHIYKMKQVSTSSINLHAGFTHGYRLQSSKTIQQPFLNMTSRHTYLQTTLTSKSTNTYRPSSKIHLKKSQIISLYQQKARRLFILTMKLYIWTLDSELIILQEKCMLLLSNIKKNNAFFVALVAAFIYVSLPSNSIIMYKSRYHSS